MSVTVDHRPLPAEQLGLRTIGQVLSHLQKDDRLVVNVLIDGEEPDLERIAVIKQAPLSGHTLFIETAHPREMALEVLDEIQEEMRQADTARTEACELLQQSQLAPAMEKLSRCFTTWQHAQESVLKTAQLLRLDLNRIDAGGQPLTDLLMEFAGQLRQIKSVLEQRDYVSLGDILLYEIPQITAQWHAALEALRRTIEQGSRRR